MLGMEETQVTVVLEVPVTIRHYTPDDGYGERWDAEAQLPKGGKVTARGYHARQAAIEGLFERYGIATANLRVTRVIEDAGGISTGR